MIRGQRPVDPRLDIFYDAVTKILVWVPFARNPITNRLLLKFSVSQIPADLGFSAELGA